MEDRYEILGKIGQGGLGAVYRGFDTRMNREVAIKRISTVDEDPELQEESTKQLVKEAGALASLQHPNIVTIHDVGSDADGPYVVMELINGKTLDELIERAPLTWLDFKELALQTQEALIAAQERNLIHSDLKPSNLMLTWLPSGKFQVKIVDFGLASLAQSQSKHDLESIDVVFGSIFFMPPEQFERTPLDIRSDMYSIGCVFYQALTGHYPFDGKTGNDVMEAHLHHKVTPLREVRAGIPLWACDWIMWHLNRFPQDRPESARDALSLFLQNDRIPNSPMSLGVPPTPKGPPRPRMRVPVTMAGQASASPDTGTAAHSIERAKMVQTSQVGTVGNESSAITQTAPQPLAPPEGFKPSVHTASEETPPPQSTAASAHPHGSASQRLSLPPPPPPARKLSKGIKIGIAVASAAILLVIVVVFMKLGNTKRDARLVEEILAKAEVSGTTELPVNNQTLQLILRSLTRDESDSNVQRVCTALAMAKPTDSTDVDARVADFVTNGPTLTVRTKEAVIGGILRPRNNSGILPAMLELANSNGDPALIVAALQSTRLMMGDEHLGSLLHLLTSTGNDLVRDASEANIAEVLRKTSNLGVLTQQLTGAQESNFKPEVQRALKRLISSAKTLLPPEN